MKIALAADHAGFELKMIIRGDLEAAHHDVLDLGASEQVPTDDYPDFAALLGNALVSSQAERGVMICGSGVGVCVALNKFPGVRAAICHDTYSAHQGVEHDDMNVLCLGARIVGVALAREIVRFFVAAHFTGEDRHLRRLRKVHAIEKRFVK